MYNICIIHGQPQYDSLPVAKILNYPLEKRDYKPYAQFILAMSREGLHVRMWAFEALPSPLSCLETVINLSPENSGRYLSVSLYADGNQHCRILENGEPASFAGEGLHEPACHWFAGEDLQGIYWGGALLLGNSLLQAVYGSFSLELLKQPRGNLYKLSEDPKSPHYGSLYPAGFPDTPYSEASMGEFALLDY